MDAFSEFEIGDVTTRNRLIMAPVKTAYGTPNGEVTHRQVAYYRRRAEGGVGAIVVESLFIDPMGKEHPKQLGIASYKHLEGLKRLTTAIHDGGAIAIAHLNHAGRAANPKATNAPPEAPSAVPCRSTGVTPIPMTGERIEELVKEYAGAASRAVEAGFDVIELQFGLGYLIDQFLSSGTNLRRDEYGGSRTNRRRFGKEVLEAVRKTIGSRVPVIARLSVESNGNGSNLIEAVDAMKWLELESISALHLATGSPCDSPEWYYQHMRLPGSWNLEWAAGIKKIASIPVIVAGRMGDPQMIRAALKENIVDAVALGRPLIADPDLPDKMKNGHDDHIARCGACLQGCLAKVKSGEGLSCIVNPGVGREDDLTPRVEQPSNVIVVGGGPAGMQAALTAQSRGHRVTLLDEGELGGQFNLAVIPPGKAEMKKPLKAIVDRVRNGNITLRLGRRVTVEDILGEKPEHVILATGSIPNKIEIEGLDDVLVSEDVLLKKRDVGSRVLVIGGGMVGLETAEFLAEMGHDVTVVEMLSDVAADMEPITRKLVLKSLNEYGVRIMTETTVTSFEEETAYADGPNGEQPLGEFDTVVSAVGTIPTDGLDRAFDNLGIKVHRIGDAKKPGNIMDAVTDGYEIGRRI